MADLCRLSSELVSLSPLEADSSGEPASLVNHLERSAATKRDHSHGLFI